MPATIQTSIRIQAPVEKVWAILADFPAHSHWNPFIRSISGRLAPGEKLHIRLPGMAFRPVVRELQPIRGFSWLGHFLFPGLFDGEHFFRLEANGDGSTTFYHGEHFRGILVPVFKGSMLQTTRDGFEAMNRALKEKAERGERQQP